MLVDTHCHLGDAAYAADRDEVAARAWAAGVGHIVVIGESPASADGALALAADPRYSATAGLHPHIASDWTDESASWLSERLADSRVVAAGEMGLDYHYEHSPRPVQQRVFAAQLGLAAAAGKPAIIHAREADEDVAALLRAHPQTVCILHSFSSGMGLLRTGVALGHYVSFSGMITFRNWQQDDAIRETPRDRLLIETDGPYLAPTPHRGKRNEPAFVGRVAERLGAVLGMSAAEAAALTAENARRVFGERISSTAA